jgi:hypothetical protein
MDIPKIVAISIKPPRTTPTMVAVGTERPPDCEALGGSVIAAPFVKLRRVDVEIVETGVEENAMVVKDVVEVGVGVVELARTVVVVDALELGAGQD